MFPSVDGFVRDKQQCGSRMAGVWQTYKPDGNYTLSVRGRDINGNTGSVVSHTASELVSFHAFVIQDITLLAFYLVWSVALFLLGCCLHGLIVRCCPYYRYNLPLLKTRFILISLQTTTKNSLSRAGFKLASSGF